MRIYLKAGRVMLRYAPPHWSVARLAPTRASPPPGRAAMDFARWLA